MTLSVRRPRGLTLIELTIVLLVLAAVAGILVPRLTGYTGKSHGASGAANVAEISKAISLYEVNNGGFPPQWENMVQDVPAGAALFKCGVTKLVIGRTLLVVF